ncbi:hypothetical protein [Dactylosporangium sp. CA-233914]|uniref:hypothetical protein n=1 Tax=Dactylosporangium sp. CA-233914 TaxID=3239934 RepID=UPI003D8ECE2F
MAVHRPADEVRDVSPGPARLPRSLPGLTDVVLAPSRDGGLTTSGGSGPGLTAAGLADLLRSRGSGGHDVRIVAADGARHRTLLAAVARILDRDVYVTPLGADVRVLAARGATPGTEEYVAVDRVTRRRAAWQVIPPGPAARPSWFAVADGAVRPRWGMVSVPLPEGLCLATRADFAAWRALAARLAPGHPRLVTIGVGVDGGDLVVGGYDGSAARRGGERLAADLASLWLYGGDVRMWLTWPDEPVERRRLRDNLSQLAHSTGAVVWAPAAGRRIEVAGDCGDLVVTGGGDGAWQAFRPGHDGPARFEADRDGRLVPAGGFVVRRYRGVAAVSVPQSRSPRLSGAYPRVRPRRGLAVADLAVLDDGRLAGLCTDGVAVALGGARLRRLLGDPAASGPGAAIALLATPLPEQLEGLRRYLRGAAPGCAVFVPEPGSGIVIADDAPRVVRADGPARWERLDDGDPRGGDPGWESRDGWLVPRRRSDVSKPEPGPVDPPAAEWPEGPFIGPRLEEADRDGRGHGLPWLRERPQINAAPFELYLPSVQDPQRVLERGLANPWLFLVGHLDPGLLAHEIRQGYLLQVSVERHGAVDVPASDAIAPGDAAARAARLGAYLLPAAWLERTRVVSVLRVAGGELVAREPVADGRLRTRCSGAGHGVAGLPEEATAWPQTRLRRYRTGYALLPVAGPTPAWLTLHRRPPAPQDGFRLATLRVRAGTAIDVAATAERLAALPAVHAAADRLVGRGTALVLPWRSYRATPLVALAEVRGSRWRRVSRGAARTLTAHLPAGGTAPPSRA